MSYRESALRGMAHKAEHDLKGTCPLVEDEAIVWAVEMIDRHRSALEQIKLYHENMYGAKASTFIAYDIACKALEEV